MGDNPGMKTALLALLAACGRETAPAPPADTRPVRAEQVGVKLGMTATVEVDSEAAPALSVAATFLTLIPPRESL